MRVELVLSALDMALGSRKPESVIHHSDQGSQHASLAFGKRCREMGVRPSMGTVGDAYDNAMAESFFASLECELIDRKTFRTKTEARLAFFTWIEGWYNPRRRHSALGYLSPMNYEEKHRAAQANLDKPGLPTGPGGRPPAGRGGRAPAWTGASGPVDNPAIEYDHTA
jgi:putative transposase